MIDDLQDVLGTIEPVPHYMTQSMICGANNAEYNHGNLTCLRYLDFSKGANDLIEDIIAFTLPDTLGTSK